MKQKKFILATALATLVIFSLILVKFFVKQERQPSKILPEEEVLEKPIPTVDSAVIVDLKPITKGEISLILKDVPDRTKTIEFELSYESENKDTGEGKSTVLQGAIGKCFEIKDKWECGEPTPNGRKIVLGTCSSGACRYHNIVGPIKVYLRFSGSYGEKIYEEEVNL